MEKQASLLQIGNLCMLQYLRTTYLSVVMVFPFAWFVSQLADICVSCTKGSEFYLCTLTICIFH